MERQRDEDFARDVQALLLPKQNVAGSNPVSRSIPLSWTVAPPAGTIGSVYLGRRRRVDLAASGDTTGPTIFGP